MEWEEEACISLIPRTGWPGESTLGSKSKKERKNNQTSKNPRQGSDTKNDAEQKL